MKNFTFLYSTFSILLILCYASTSMFAQNLTEIEGTLQIEFDSHSAQPHIHLIEDDFDYCPTTIKMTNDNVEDSKFEIQSYLAGNPRIGWSYNGLSRMVYSVQNEGLGIGIDLPVATLHVNGDGIINGGLVLGNTILSPSQLLHLKFSGSNGIRVEGDGTGDARGLFLSNGGGSHFIFDDASDNNNLVVESNHALVFSTDGPNERMVIEDNGNININANGAGLPNSRIGLFTDNNNYGIFAKQEGVGISFGMSVSTQSNGSESKYGITGAISGIMGTGSSFGVRGIAPTNPANFWAVYALGDMWYTGDLKAPSDRRLKKNIQDMESVLPKVLQLETKTYEFDREKYAELNLAKGPQFGFIAQNVQTLFPTLVEEERHTYQIDTGEDTGEITEGEVNILGMSSIEMIPILTKAIQEQQVLIDQQKAMMDDQRDLINQLRIDLEDLKRKK